MNLEDFKWDKNDVSTNEVSKESLLKMMGINKNPVVVGIKRQLAIESVAWILFLASYYNFFDGASRPFYWNILLILSIVLLLAHNLLGYDALANLRIKINLVMGLREYLLKLKRYAWISILCRVSALIILFGYFLSGLGELENRHYWSLLIVLLIVFIQAFFLNRIWSKRIARIQMKLNEFLS